MGRQLVADAVAGKEGNRPVADRPNGERRGWWSIWRVDHHLGGVLEESIKPGATDDGDLGVGPAHGPRLYGDYEAAAAFPEPVDEEFDVVSEVDDLLSDEVLVSVEEDLVSVEADLVSDEAEDPPSDLAAGRLSVL
jgi:hypothetical protein